MIFELKSRSHPEMITSYAQNFEDVLLWRALKDVENGFYIDIGAQAPVFDSVSLAFYEQGWRGVHVEPYSMFAQTLREARPDETVIEAFVGGKHGLVQFYEVQGTGLSTADRDLAARHAADGLTIVPKMVASIPLAKIFETYRDRDIHWLKIDVEGHEADVIESWLPSTVRPWIVVVEATVPRSQTPFFEGWEPTLLGLGYNFVYFDGLNRFYVSHSHLRLAEAFGPGPNYFDKFQLTHLSEFTQALTHKYETQLGDMRTGAQRQESEIGSLQTSRQSLEARVTELEGKLASAENELTRLHTVIAEQTEDAKGKLASSASELARLRAVIAEQTEDTKEKLSSSASELARLRNVIIEQVTQTKNANHQAQVLSEHIDTIHRSTSWRATAPLRWLVALVRK